MEKSLALLDDTFSDFLMKKISQDKFETRIGAALSALPLESGNKHFEVTIINQNHKDPFFGMYVYPVIDQMDAFTDEMINKPTSLRELSKKWKTIKDWYIEIDAICFDRNVLNFNPKELTAMILHEVGHTIYSDKVIERWYRMYQDCKSRIKLTDKVSLKVLYSLYTIPLAVSCMQKNWVNSKNAISVEYYADGTLVKYGYGDALVSALDKIIKASGSQNQSEQEKDKAVETSINWCNINATDFVHRHEKLKDEIFYQSIKSQSGFFKALNLRLLQKLGIRMREKYTGYVAECTMEMLNDPELYYKYAPAYESATLAKWTRAVNYAKSAGQVDVAMELFGRNKKNKAPKLPSQYDIDMISVEIDKITNHYDRTYVLDLIYKVLEDIEVFEDSMTDDDPKFSRYQAQIASYRKQLNDLRKQCLGKKNLEKEYRLFVKYPAGYEG